MQFSNNYSLKLPEHDDVVDVSVLSDNFAAIDGLIKAAPDTLEPVGTVKLTTRTSLGPGWLPCSGARVDQEQYPELAEQLSFDFKKRSFPYQLNQVYGKPDVLTAVTNASARTFRIYQRNLTGYAMYTIPSQAGGVDLSAYYLTGLDWNGAQWIACLTCPGKGWAYLSSSNLSSWTHAKSISQNQVISYSSCREHFLFDGAAYRQLYHYSPSGGVLSAVMSLDRNFNDRHLFSMSTSEHNSICFRAGFFQTSANSYLNLYVPGADEVKTQFINATRDLCMLRLSDAYGVLYPKNIGDVSYSSCQIRVVRLSDMHLTEVDIGTSALPFRAMAYDAAQERFLFLLGDPNGSNSVYSLKKGADPTAKGNYTLTASNASYILGLTKSVPTDDFLASENTSVCDPRAKFLPSVSVGSGIHAYIKAMA